MPMLQQYSRELLHNYYKYLIIEQQIQLQKVEQRTITFAAFDAKYLTPLDVVTKEP
jgi:hypothetical protein